MSDKLQLGGAAAQIEAFVRGLTLKQKAMIAGSAVLVAGLLAFFVMLMNRPDLKPLVSNLSPADAQALNAKLAAKGLHSQITADGSGVEVSSDQLDKARMELASAGMPSGGRMGFELFDKPNWMGSDFAEKVNYQRALEGELERTIASLQEVESARVHLVMERESLFTDRERDAKAAVVLKLKRQLTPETAAAIAQLVANAVDGLNPANVSLVSADGHVPLAPKPKGPFAVADADLEAQLTQQVVATLEPVVGADHVKANVRVEYDTATSEETKEIYDPNSAVAITKQSSRERTPGAMTNGVPGTASNVPSTTTSVPKPSVTVTDGGSSSETESATYAVSRTVRRVNQPAGMIKRISAAIMVDAARPHTPEELKKIESIAGAALGVDSKRGDTLVVENIAFQAPPTEPVSKVTIVQRVSRIAHDWSGVLRIVGILALFAVVYMLVLRPVKRQVVTTVRQLATQKIEAATSALKEQVEVDEAASKANIRRELVERVKAEPEVASRLLQSWIHSPEAHS